MGRKKKFEATSNPTKDRLAGTPFSSMGEMAAATEEIRKETWYQLERSRIKRELLLKPEFKFFLEPFKRGMVCKYGETTNNLVRVYLNDDGGIEVDINEEMKSAENSGALLSALIRSTSDSLFSNYLKSMDIIMQSEDTFDPSDKHLAKKALLKKKGKIKT